MFARILVPLDGSAFAESALPAAQALCESADALLELVTVHEELPNFMPDGSLRRARSSMDKYLVGLSDRLGRGGVAPTVTHLSGYVGDTLVDYANEGATDLVVAATHGRGPLTRAWLGSVADYLVRHAAVPVLLVRPAEDIGGDLDFTIGRILVPFDGSDAGHLALARAEELARLSQASIVLVSVIIYPTEIASPYLPDTVQFNQRIVEEAADAARVRLDDVARLTRERGIETHVDVRVGHQAGKDIADAAEEHDVDLVAMCSQSRGRMTRALLGSTTDKVIRASTRPVLVLPAQST